MAGTTIFGLSPTTFPILTSQPDPRQLYTEKEWEYIDAYNKKQEEKVLEFNPYPSDTIFSTWGDPLNGSVFKIDPGLLDKNGAHPNEFKLQKPKVFGHSGKDFFSQMNVDAYNPWKCHTCGGNGESQVEKENTYYDGVYDKFNGLACADCKGTGKEAVPMYDLLSEDDQKAEYKAHEDNGDF